MGLIWKSWGLLLFVFVVAAHAAGTTTHQGEKTGKALLDEEPAMLRTIEGKVAIEGEPNDGWLSRTKVVVDGGKYFGFLRSNGQFEIPGVSPGSYLVEVVSPNHAFEPARVEISSKSGKIRAKKVNLLKPSSVTGLPYPLKFKAEKQASFFEKREKWNIMDTLKNPMVWLMVGPVLIMLVLPKLMKGLDPEYQKEMQENMDVMSSGQQSMPSLEEMATKLFGGGGASPKAIAKKPKPAAKRPTRR